MFIVVAVSSYPHQNSKMFTLYFKLIKHYLRSLYTCAIHTPSCTCKAEITVDMCYPRTRDVLPLRRRMLGPLVRLAVEGEVVVRRAKLWQLLARPRRARRERVLVGVDPLILGLRGGSLRCSWRRSRRRRQ